MGRVVDTISVAAGTYNLALGETFPLVFAVNLTLTGAGAPTTTINATGAATNVITINPATTVLITGVTITGGSVSCAGSCSAHGGGLFSDGGAPTLTATIIALQLAGADCADALPTSTGFNLDSDNTCNLTQVTDKPGITSPGLGPLQNNGGPTQTHALLPGSQAIDMVLSGCPPPATDQRGVSRPQGAACDIGAYELEAQTPIPTLFEWAHLAMLTLLLGGGLFALRRRIRPA